MSIGALKGAGLRFRASIVKALRWEFEVWAFAVGDSLETVGRSPHPIMATVPAETRKAY